MVLMIDIVERTSTIHSRVLPDTGLSTSRYHFAQANNLL